MDRSLILINFKRHMLYHTGARNFQCDLCVNKFFQMEHLKRHMQSIHNITSVSNSNSQSNSSKTMKRKKLQGTLQLQKPNPTDLINANPQINPGINLNCSDTNVQEKCLKVTSNCIYKCKDCEFSNVELYKLNEHIIRNHSSLVSSDLASFVESKDVNLETDEDSGVSNSGQNEKEDTTFIINKNNEIFSSSESDKQIFKIFPCSFCTFKTNKKSIIKRHLDENHSSLSPPEPIFLSNDPILTDINTK